MAKEPTWEEAIQTVLKGTSEPLHYGDIADRVVAEQIKKTVGATPPATVAATLARLVKDPDCGIQRLGKGYYSLKSNETQISQVETTADVPDDVAEAGALRAFGMFWRRDLVVWDSKPKLLGRQSSAAATVNFAGQVGVYLLHDRDRVIYVGRASESMAARLKAHTIDRLSGRWDRFSWFGLKRVDEKGELSEMVPQWSAEVVIDTMEALLIESLEPPLNRRRGDNLGSLEYIQESDPEIVKQERKRLLLEMANKIGIENF